MIKRNTTERTSRQTKLVNRFTVQLIGINIQKLHQDWRENGDEDEEHNNTKANDRQTVLSQPLDTKTSWGQTDCRSSR
jgi:hypothetical protein